MEPLNLNCGWKFYLYEFLWHMNQDFFIEPLKFVLQELYDTHYRQNVELQWEQKQFQFLPT